jgi:hypothetical protein
LTNRPKMKFTKTNLSFNAGRALPGGACLLVSAVLVACGGGGGGGVVELPETAVVQSVSDAHVLEGSAGASAQLEFVVTLDKPAVKGVDVTFSTLSTAKAGIDSAGSAKGGASCDAGTDFISVSNSKVSIAKGASTVNLQVSVCGDSAFEPNETLKISWTSSSGGAGTATGKIVNDDAGGLNGSGATTVMGGVAAFGRDTNSLTNASADGALGFSFERQPSATSWNCTYDKVSGLTWERLSGFTSTYASLGSYVQTVNTAQPCGYSDWRVPTSTELLSLMDASTTNGNAPNADRVGATDAMTGQFWTSEITSFSTNNAWLVDADNGGAVSYKAITNPSGVRLVRGSAISSVCDKTDQRFSDLTDGTVADAKTGLMWKQCQEGSSGSACTEGTPFGFSQVTDITNRVSAVNTSSSSTGLGYSDWRIPTKNELASLVNRACTGGPVINADFFPGTESASYVSATYDANNADQFWFVSFLDGTISKAGILNKRLRLVRAGQ